MSTVADDRLRASDRAYLALRGEILDAELGAGTVLAEVEQSQRLGVSRTPLREALELQAARLAARRRDPAVFTALRDEFRNVDDLLSDRHGYYDLVARLDNAIDDAAANPILVSNLDGVRTHVARIRRLSQDDPTRLRDAAREHLQILDAIIDGDESLAASATQVHLRNSLRNILSTLSPHQDKD